ncbi:MAG TPA: hypothetical protein VMZ50_13605 [Phycisphaerae bacterium]|nr:hypothetical protein [Phycisphaerae bacterium]
MKKKTRPPRSSRAVAADADSTEKIPAAAGKAGGLECPRCGCRHFRTVYTRAHAGLRVGRDPETKRQVIGPAEAGAAGGVVRRRECRHCGRRMTTYEAPKQE